MAAQSLSLLDAVDLCLKEFPPLVWLVDGLLPKGGAAILAAPPKRRKSFLALDLAVSIALGRPFLGRRTAEGHSLYLALEDGERRLQTRIQRILNGQPIMRGTMKTAVTAPRLDEGLLEEIRRAKSEDPALSLVVIDIFQRVRAAGEKSNDYALDYGALAPVNTVANDLGITILVVHHTRKSMDEDAIFDSISGSNGIFGAVTTAWILEAREYDTDATLHAIGKDLEADRLKLRFNRNLLRFEPVADLEALKRESANPLARVVVRLVDKHGGEWQGSMTDFSDYANLQREFSGSPKPPSAYGRMLKAGDKNLPAIRAEGVEVSSNGRSLRFYRVN